MCIYFYTYIYGVFLIAYCIDVEKTKLSFGGSTELQMFIFLRNDLKRCSYFSLADNIIVMYLKAQNFHAVHLMNDKLTFGYRTTWNTPSPQIVPGPRAMRFPSAGRCRRCDWIVA